MFPTGPNTTPDLLKPRALSDPDSVAIVLECGSTTTFREIEDKSNALAWGLLSRSVSKGDYIGIRFDSQRWIEFTIAYFAVHKIGGIVVFLPPLAWTQDERGWIPESIRRIGVIAPHDLLEDLSALGDRLIWSASPAELLDGNPVEQHPILVGPEDIAEISRKSGTSGAPGFISSSHDNVTYHSRCYCSFPSIVDLGKSPPILLKAPGLDVPRLGFPLLPFAKLTRGYNFQTVVIMSQFKPRVFCSLIEEFGVTYASISPAQALGLLNFDAFSDLDVTSLKALQISGSRTPRSIVGRLEDAFPEACMVITYGCDESGPLRIWYAHKRGSDYPRGLVGSPAEYTDRLGRVIAKPEVRIFLDPEESFEDRTAGELWFRCKGMPRRSYYDDPEANARVFWDDEWIRTGDIGTLDSDGQIYVLDRRDDNITRGIHVVASLEIEDVFFEHESVVDVAAFGISDDVLGEEVALAVALREPTRVADLRRFARERLEPHKVPRLIFILDSLPRNMRGKIVKRKLAEILGGNA